MNSYKKILALREAGNVRRAHTCSIIGEYNIAQHSWNAVNLLFCLWPPEPPPPMSLVRAVLWHDVPERWTGDTPAPVKWFSSILKQDLDHLEAVMLNKLDILEPFKQLSDKEKSWLRGVDLLELFLWVQEQTQLGNRTLYSMYAKIKNHFDENKEKFPTEIINCARDLVWERLPEIDEFLTEE